MCYMIHQSFIFCKCWKKTARNIWQLPFINILKHFFFIYVFVVGRGIVCLLAYLLCLFMSAFTEEMLPKTVCRTYKALCSILVTQHLHWNVHTNYININSLENNDFGMNVQHFNITSLKHFFFMA